MRRFTLTNAKLESFDVMDWTNGAFFSAPQGLGAAWTTDTVLSGGYWLKTKRELNQPNITGQMIFRTYDVYHEFVKFVAQGPLVLGYTPTEDIDEHYVNCEVENLGKTERDSQFGVLYCPITFKCLSPWYGRLVIERSTIDTSAAKYYAYEYPYKYYDQGNGYLRLENAGSKPAPCRMVFHGDVVNPTWTLVADGETVATGAVTVTVSAGNMLVVDSTPTSMEIAEYTEAGEFVANRYSVSDFTTQRFIWLPPGFSYLQYSHSGGNELEMEVEVRSLADSV